MDISFRYEEWTSEDFMALPELVEVLYENQVITNKLTMGENEFISMFLFRNTAPNSST